MLNSASSGKRKENVQLKQAVPIVCNRLPYTSTNITFANEISDLFSLTYQISFPSLPFPCFFLPTPGESRILLKMWWQIFENYLMGIGAMGNSWPDARCRAVLLHYLGTEGRCLFYSLPDAGTTYDTAVKLLVNYLMPKSNIIAERHAFCKRTQTSNETVLQYVLAQCELALMIVRMT